MGESSRRSRQRGRAGQRVSQDRDGACLTEAIELVADTRLSLSLNVSEELALEALAYRLEALAR